MKKIVLLIILLASIALASWLLVQKAINKRTTQKANSQHKIQIVASCYPIAFFAAQVGGDLVNVQTLVKTGLEPHDYEPSPQDIIAIDKAQLFVYNGAGLEVWANKIVDSLPAQKIVNTSAKIAIKQTDGLPDPHVWVDPVLATAQVAAIQEALSKVDPIHQQIYQQNAAKFILDLQNLDQEYKQGLANCPQHTIISQHDAFNYLSRQYGFRVTAIAGLSPDAEPSPQKLAEISQFVKKNQIKYIFFEALVSPKLAQTIAQETGAQTAVLDPVEGLTADGVNSGQNYLTIQAQNLHNIRQALECK